MTETERELKDEAAKMVKLMDKYPQADRATLLLNVISNIYAAGKEAGQQEAYSGRKEALA